MTPAISSTLPMLMNTPPHATGADVALFTLALTGFATSTTPAAADRRQLAAPGKPLPEAPKATVDPLAWLLERSAAAIGQPPPILPGAGPAIAPTDPNKAEPPVAADLDVPGRFVTPSPIEWDDSAPLVPDIEMETERPIPVAPVPVQHTIIPDRQLAAAATPSDFAPLWDETEPVAEREERIKLSSAPSEVAATFNQPAPLTRELISVTAIGSQTRPQVTAMNARRQIEATPPVELSGTPVDVSPTKEVPTTSAAAEMPPGRTGWSMRTDSTPDAPVLEGVTAPSPAPIASEQSSQLVRSPDEPRLHPHLSATAAAVSPGLHIVPPGHLHVSMPAHAVTAVAASPTTPAYSAPPTVAKSMLSPLDQGAASPVRMPDGSLVAEANSNTRPEPPTTPAGSATPISANAISLVAPVAATPEPKPAVAGLVPSEPSRTGHPVADTRRPAPATRFPRPKTAAPLVPPAPTNGPAAQVFAAAIRRGVREAGPSVAPELQALAATNRQPAPITPPTPAPLDLRQDHWPSAMVERIERLWDAADSADTRIRLVPDALGSIEVSVKREGEAVHVQFAADQAATRALIHDAAPRLAEAADARGLKLGQVNVGGGGADANGRQQQASSPNTPLTPVPPRQDAPSADELDTRIA